jgi:hypothetical protein
MDVIDEFDINIIKEWKRYAYWQLLQIRAPAHQSFNGAGNYYGIKLS